jgi:hypothetical protein
MLGRFLEVALVTGDAGEDWQRLQQLGFEPAPTGDIWPHPYGVVACEGIALGLHARGEEPLCLMFVRPDVAGLHRELMARGVRIEHARLGSDAFNELALREPGGMLLRVLEARTFSPPADMPGRTRFGRFDAISLPCRDLAAAAAFWKALGYEPVDSGAPLEGIRVPATPVACHPRRLLAEPALLFRQPDPDLEHLVGDTPHMLLQGTSDLAVLVMT